MTGWDGIDLDYVEAAGVDGTDTDALLNRLGRREPVAVDLDDPLATALALLVEDVDVMPVPVEVTRHALITAAAWPLPERGTIVSPYTSGEGAPVAAWTVTAAGGRLPRQVRVRSSTGLLAAAVLAVVGGGLSTLAVTGDGLHPSADVTSIVQRPNGHPSSTAGGREVLAARLETARRLLEGKRSVEAEALIADVRSHLDELDAADRRELSAVLVQLEAQVQPTATGTFSSPGPFPTAHPFPDAFSSGESSGLRSAGVGKAGLSGVGRLPGAHPVGTATGNPRTGRSASMRRRRSPVTGKAPRGGAGKSTGASSSEAVSSTSKAAKPKATVRAAGERGQTPH